MQAATVLWLVGCGLLAGCGGQESAPVRDEDPTRAMVRRLEELRDGIDRRRSPFANAGRAAQLAAADPPAGLRERFMRRGDLAEQLMYAGRFQEAFDSLTALREDALAAGGWFRPSSCASSTASALRRS